MATQNGLVRLDTLPNGARFQYTDETRVYVVVEAATSGAGGAVLVSPAVTAIRFGEVATVRRGELVREVK